MNKKETIRKMEWAIDMGETNNLESSDNYALCKYLQAIAIGIEYMVKNTKEVKSK